MRLLDVIPCAMLLVLATSACHSKRATVVGEGLDARSPSMDAARPIDPAQALHIEMPAPPSPGIVDAGTEHDAADAGPPLPRAYPRLLRGLASDAIPLGRVVDSDRGVTFVDYLEPGQRPHARPQIATRQLCGAALAPGGELHGEIVAMVQQSAELGVPIDCARSDCTVPSFEYGVFYHVRFERRSNGDPLLVALWRTSEATMGDDWLAAMSRYVHTHLAAAAATRCTPAGPAPRVP
jgi:hypothetical protein